jgi:hypothetical protein
MDIRITRHRDKASAELFRKALDGLPIQSVTLIVPGKDGSEFQIHLTDVIVGGFSLSRDPVEPMETLTLSPATARFVGPETAPPPPREPTWQLLRDLRNSQ